MLKKLLSRLKMRAMSAQEIEWKLYRQLQLIGLDVSYPTMFMSNGESYLVYVDRGKLFRVDATISEASVEFDEPQEIYVEHLKVSRANMVVQRTDEGLKFAGIAGSATINRSLELDSTSLFDDLEANFDAEDDYAINFYHKREDINYRMGRVEKIQRSGNLLIVYGIIDENTLLGREAARNFSESDDWGFSIEFFPSEYELIKLDSFQVRCFTKGRFDGLAIVLEEDASHFFTKIVS